MRSFGELDTAIMDRVTGHGERLTEEVIAVGQSERRLYTVLARLKDGLGADIVPGLGGIDCVEA